MVARPCEASCELSYSLDVCVAPLRLGGIMGKKSTPSVGWEVPVRSCRLAGRSEEDRQQLKIINKSNRQLWYACVTHYFSHLDKDYINTCSGSQYTLLPEKRNLFPPLQDAFLEGCCGLLPLHSAEIPDFYRLHYSQPIGFLQAII